ncbi:GTP cyclohydrolase N terminal-domain-containing protein [Lasiosphaeris hirsuta]|uniref:GTP cyclohydrolase N terminal-domain-containing protein n=1 Tax=Lasiosphaeris hirsuta TaxID=260670 RepID=A0AA40E2R0_9PEZI|nr:GTP cyclohydrolase N terminal-domain-containing protein [Lasiosphaeris hirsuta]
MATTGMDEVRNALQAISQSQTLLLSAFESVSQRVNKLEETRADTPSPETNGSVSEDAGRSDTPLVSGYAKTPPLLPADAGSQSPPPVASTDSQSGFSSRIILTTYPKQIGIKPLPMEWGAADPEKRGPVAVSRSASTIRRRNAIGAHSGSYSIYYALALASKELDPDHRPDFTNSEPAVNIGPFPQWGDKKKIVAMDPWGHVVPWQWKDVIEKENGMFWLASSPLADYYLTLSHMKLSELEESVRSGRLVPDGKVCLNSAGELAVTKFAVEPVWYLPGVAERFGIDEGTLRRSLFEHTGGMYPECNGSDVFGSDICTCRPYLIFGIEEAVKEAQNGGTGVVIYFRKEGRALGEVTKYLVYNARKRGEDRASDYFKRTENIAGVKDMRFQALMPDILHWLGITKIDRMLSMSNMKHDAIVGQGIPIHERVELPESWIPADSRVEIDAKITAGHRMTAEELKAVQGRIWEEADIARSIDH